jgi:hypothetical protein
MSPSVSASRRPSSSLPRRSSWCAGGTTAIILTDTIIKATPLGAITTTPTGTGATVTTTRGAPTGIRIATGVPIIMTGIAGRTEGSPGTCPRACS